MITDWLENLSHYWGFHPELDKVIDFLVTRDPFALPLGRTEIDGDAVFVNVMETTLIPPEKAKWECHKLYADVQLVLASKESIGCLPVGQVQSWGDYRPDIAQSDDPALGSVTALSPGMFCIYFPWDAHKPGIGAGHGKKAVFKARME